jgi:spermidine synthase
LYSAALLAGFGALSLQMVWGRELAILVGPTTFAFSALVVVFIAGLGAGSLCFALLCERLRDARRWIALATLLVVVGTIGGRLLSPWLAQLVGLVQAQRSSALFNAVLCSGVSAALELIATFAMGMFFPALVALAAARTSQAGASVGRIYGWNTLGSIVGALCTLTLLLPWIGAQGTTLLALASYVLALLLALAPRWKGREVELAVVLASVAILIAPWRNSDPRLTNLGLYLYSPRAWNTLSGEGSRIVSFFEGANANVLTLELDADENTPGAPGRIKNLRVNGKVDASNWADMPMQLGSAYFPMILRPESRSVLVIGMGSGTTVGAALAFPDTQVTCCELEPAIVEAARSFAPENKNPHDSPRLTIVTDDGRNHVQASSSGFDLIISEPSNPWIAGISNLYTQNFYRIVRERLNRGGMFVQWMQTYGLSAEQHALIAGTLLSVFPQVALLRINEYDTLFLCASEPIVPSSERLDAAQKLVDELSDVRADLQNMFGSSDVRCLLLSVLALDHAGVRTLSTIAAEGAINTDANMRLEFGAPRDLFEMQGSTRRRPVEAIAAAFDPRSTAQLIAGWGWSEEQAPALRSLKRALLARGDGKKAFALNELLLAYQPSDLEAVADQLLWQPSPDPGEFQAGVNNLVGSSPTEAARVAKSWLDQGQFARARMIYQELIKTMPDSPTVLAGLALCQVNLAEPERARELLQRARKIDPLDSLVRDLERAMEQP